MGGFSSCPRAGQRNESPRLAIWLSKRATSTHSGASQKRQIGGWTVSLKKRSIGVAGSLSFLHRQVEQGRSASWPAEVISTETLSDLARAEGMKMALLSRINSELEAFFHSMCLDDEPHLAKATGLTPRQTKTTSSNRIKALERTPRVPTHTSPPDSEGKLTFRFFNPKVHMAIRQSTRRRSEQKILVLRGPGLRNRSMIRSDWQNVNREIWKLSAIKGV